jgi:hypothetical protein
MGLGAEKQPGECPAAFRQRLEEAVRIPHRKSAWQAKGLHGISGIAIVREAARQTRTQQVLKKF